MFTRISSVFSSVNPFRVTSQKDSQKEFEIDVDWKNRMLDRVSKGTGVSQFLRKSHFASIDSKQGALFVYERVTEILTLIHKLQVASGKKNKMAKLLFRKLKKIKPFGADNPYDHIRQYAQKNFGVDEKYMNKVISYSFDLKDKVSSEEMIKVEHMIDYEIECEKLKNFLFSGSGESEIKTILSSKPSLEVYSMINTAFPEVEGRVGCLPHLLVHKFSGTEKLAQGLIFLRNHGISLNAKIEKMEEAEPSIKPEVVSFRNFLREHEGLTPLHIAQKLYSGSPELQHLATQALLEAGQINVNEVDKEGKTALMYAIETENCNLQNIQSLIEAGANIHANGSLNAARLIINKSTDEIPLSKKVEILQGEEAGQALLVLEIQKCLSDANDKRNFKDSLDIISILLKSKISEECKANLLKDSHTLEKIMSDFLEKGNVDFFGSLDAVIKLSLTNSFKENILLSISKNLALLIGSQGLLQEVVLCAICGSSLSDSEKNNILKHFNISPEQGRVVKSLDGSFFYFDHGNLTPLKSEKAKLLQELFPDGLRKSDFRQGDLADCTLLAALKSALYNDPVSIIKIIEPTTDGRIEFNFGKDAFFDPKTDKGVFTKPIALSIRDYKESGVKGLLGAQLLETAFGRAIKAPEEYTQVALDEGSYADKALAAMFPRRKIKQVFNNGLVLGDDHHRKSQAIEVLQKVSEFPRKVIAVASCKLNSNDGKLIANHAYAVLEVIPNEEKIILSNPHESAKLIKIDYEKFFIHFRRLTYTAL
ncbi:MAG: ankyrin repeat domain-containing protein [Burkholderiaceae bacterium]